MTLQPVCSVVRPPGSAFSHAPSKPRDLEKVPDSWSRGVFTCDVSDSDSPYLRKISTKRDDAWSVPGLG